MADRVATKQNYDLMKFAVADCNCYFLRNHCAIFLDPVNFTTLFVFFT